MQTFLRIHHGGFSVANLEETIRWYVDTLGFEEGFRYDFPPEMHTKAAFVQHGNFRLEFVEVSGSQTMPSERTDLFKDLQTQGMKHIALEVADIDKTRADLEAKGVKFIMPNSDVSNSKGERFVYFYDNNSVLLELYQPVKS